MNTNYYPLGKLVADALNAWDEARGRKLDLAIERHLSPVKPRPRRWLRQLAIVLSLAATVTLPPLAMLCTGVGYPMPPLPLPDPAAPAHLDAAAAPAADRHAAGQSVTRWYRFSVTTWPDGRVEVGCPVLESPDEARQCQPEPAAAEAVRPTDAGPVVLQDYDPPRADGRHRCQAIAISTGRQCRKLALRDSPYCACHQGYRPGNDPD